MAALTTSVLVLGACGSAGGSAGQSAGGGQTGKAGGEGPSVVVGFYPLEYATARIGGDRVKVTNLTKPGAEPHDAELTPKDVGMVGDADLAIHEKGMQPALDEAVSSQNPKAALDVSQAASLNVKVDEPIADLGGEDAHDHDHGDGHDHDHDHDHGTTAPSGAATGGADEHDGHDHDGHDHEGHNHDAKAGSIDPHFWLDPVRYGQVAKAIADRLSQVDPAGKATYEANLQALQRDLTAVDGEYRNGLSKCSNKTLVTSHAAFGYLADRYGFTQAAISGLSPEQEPDPQRLAKVADYAKKNNVKTIYAETLSSPAVAETVARETGAKTAVLDPIEGLTKDGTDYLSIMRSNLNTLKAGQGCS